jgi:hypothetical protein
MAHREDYSVLVVLEKVVTIQVMLLTMKQYMPYSLKNKTCLFGVMLINL